ncbi:hypothetical protein PsYK624_071570 [Phanerochaete sordida]|uniref:Uncharacterized protein n=1 Tax=Phanerochaete sordida TaxID=48140 RepID=A0A9P3GBW3_9APHY|nr:hypothetical protein PsYK624_071570 [Phanerochaete sordida]
MPRVRYAELKRSSMSLVSAHHQSWLDLYYRRVPHEETVHHLVRQLPAPIVDPDTQREVKHLPLYFYLTAVIPVGGYEERTRQGPNNTVILDKVFRLYPRAGRVPRLEWKSIEESLECLTVFTLVERDMNVDITSLISSDVDGYKYIELHEESVQAGAEADDPFSEPRTPDQDGFPETLDWAKLEHAALLASSPYQDDPALALAGVELLERTDVMLSAMSTGSSTDDMDIARSDTASGSEPAGRLRSTSATLSSGVAESAGDAPELITQPEKAGSGSAGDDAGADPVEQAADGGAPFELPALLDVIFTVETRVDPDDDTACSVYGQLRHWAEVFITD